MNNPVSATSIDEAKTSLETINLTQDKAINAFRPPLWWIVLSAVFLALSIFSSIYNQKNLSIVTVTSCTLFFACFFYWLRWLKRRGLSYKCIPATTASKIFLVLQIVFFCGTPYISAQLYEQGFRWAPHTGAVITALGFIICMWKYPTSVWKTTKENR